MGSVQTFKCTSCGGYLEFDPDSQQFACPFCGQSYDTNQVRERQEAEKPLRGYHCQSCGAEIVTGETTAATRCYYCHSPVVLSDRLTDEFRPDGVVPFRLDKKQAENAFRTLLKKKRFADERFFDTAMEEDFSGVYYPYWMADVDGYASFIGEGTRVSRRVTPSHVITTTRYFSVHREGDVELRQISRRALKAANRELAEGIHPYDLTDEKAFNPGYLSGFLAEKRDIPQEQAEQEIRAEAKEHAHTLISGRENFDTLQGSTTLSVKSVKMRQLLLPVWVMIYHHAEKTYYYMMNGQTGSVCGNLPVNHKKVFLWAGGIFAAIFGGLCAGGAFLW